MNRKDFLKSSVALCGLSLIPTGVIQSCKKQNYDGPSNVNFQLDLNLAANASLNSIGGALIANGVLVIRLDAFNFSALSATCTHEGCSVNYNNGLAKVTCPCHGASFNATTGAVLGGPAPNGLRKYTATLSGNLLTVKS